MCCISGMPTLGFNCNTFDAVFHWFERQNSLLLIGYNIYLIRGI